MSELSLRPQTPDEFLRPVHIHVKDPAGNTIMEHRYTWDVTSRLVEKETEHGTYRYAYDAGYRLSSAENPTLPDEAYSYDPAGNRLPADPVEQASWTYGADNEVRAAGWMSFEYDTAGNRVLANNPGPMSTYEYDEHGALIRFEDTITATTSTYQYDPFRRRIAKDLGGNVRHFFYLGAAVVAEIEGDGSVVGSFGYVPREAQERTPGLALSSALPLTSSDYWESFEKLFILEGSYKFVHGDAFDDMAYATEVSGILFSSIYCDAFDLRCDGINVPALRVPWQYSDIESDLKYNWHRYYDARQGAFTSADPLSRLIDIRASGAGMVDVVGANGYLFTQGDPINQLDPSGLWIIPDPPYDPRPPIRDPPNVPTPPQPPSPYPVPPPPPCDRRDSACDRRELTRCAFEKTVRYSPQLLYCAVACRLAWQSVGFNQNANATCVLCIAGGWGFIAQDCLERSGCP